MERTKLGENGPEVSRIGLGLAALGRPGYINLGHGDDLPDRSPEAMETHAKHMMSLALESGITYFDAAQSYGKAEEFLSRWMHQHKPDVVAGSKWGYTYTAGWEVDAEVHEVKDHSLATLDRQWPESRQRLSPWLRLYQIHSATFESGVLENTEVLNRLDEIKSGGTLIGLSLSGANQGALLEKAMTIRIQQRPLFDAVQATYNILETAVETSLRKAHDQGWGVIAKEVLANGYLTPRSRLETVAKIRQKFPDRPVDQVALSYVLSKPFVDVALSGAAHPDHLESNLNVTSLSENQSSFLNTLNLDPDSYWEQRKRLQWN